MRGNNIARRAFITLLAMVTLVSTLVPALSAADDNASASGATQSIEEVKELMSAISFQEYLDKHAAMPMGKGEIIVTANDLITEDSTGLDQVYTNFTGTNGKPVVGTQEEGSVVYKFTVPEAGLYNIAMDFYPIEGKTSSIERTLRIDDKVPFKEARYITMTKIYVDDYLYDENGEIYFKTDVYNNEMRPVKQEAPEWRTIVFEDSSGFYQEPFLFYLTAGEHTLSLEAIREPVVLGDIRIYVAPTPPTYDEYIAALEAQGVTNGTAEIETIQAEKPIATSDVVIYQIQDRTSAITQPQSASSIRLNSIGAERWQNYGMWIEYKVDVPEGGAGLYKIVTRFKQSIYSGVYSTRKVYINGELPFKEAAMLRFNYGDRWQVEGLNDGTLINGSTAKDPEYEEFKFYFKEGENIIRFEVALGEMADILREVEESLFELNEMYRKIRMITGTSPDAYRDYFFERTIPEVLINMGVQSANLYDISARLEEIIGAKGEHTVILDKVALHLLRMYEDQDLVASGMGTLKSNIGSIGTWLLERRNQPLQLDYIQILPVDAENPQVEANFFQSFLFEIQSFIMSFFTDYSSVGASNKVSNKDEVVKVWIVTGRDQAQIIRQMIDDGFTPLTQVRADLKLVAGGVLQATLAGTGPDVSMSTGASETINFAIRSAVLPLNDFQGDASRGIASFEETKTWFHESAFVPLTLQDDTKPADQWNVYGLPVTETFPMMFYRKDILAELDIEIPKTWDDLYSIIPELQKKNYEVGFPVGTAGLQLFMFQQNEPFYKGDGIAINVDSNLALDSFKKMMDLFTVYRFPITFDFANRFRTGEMPIGFVSYDTYNQLVVFAPEIRGLWEFVPIPGTIRLATPEDEGKNYAIPLDIDGNEMEGYIIDNDSTAAISNVMMLRTAKVHKNEENSWAFMQWWVGAEAQAQFGNEMVAVQGAAAKQPTANLEALYGMPWPTKDRDNLQAQFEHLEATPEVPGSYIVGRYIDFAWKDVYNGGTSPSETMLDYVPEINKELSRKRSEFGWPTLESTKAVIE